MRRALGLLRFLLLSLTLPLLPQIEAVRDMMDFRLV
jgi:hypothetical protein